MYFIISFARMLKSCAIATSCVKSCAIATSCSSSLECLPGDVIEAMSSLVFAASRCGELPELNTMRNLLKRRFGNVELLKENLVNANMKHNLCISFVPNDEKLQLIKKIAEENGIQLGFQNFGTISGHSQTDSDSRHHKKITVQMDQQKALPSAMKSSTRKCDPLKENGSSVSFKNCRSLDSSIDKLKEKKGKLSGHVHPNLPDYEEIVAKLTDLKVEHKRRLRRKHFSFFLEMR